MKHALVALALFVSLCPRAYAQGAGPMNNEALTYNVNWPSGLSLGEAQLKAARTPGSEGAAERWDLQFALDAAVPGFAVTDRYRSSATSELCSLQFDKEVARGKKTAKEQTKFDQEAGSATRETSGGGSSELRTSPCARDALAFLYYLRRELSQGRLPPPQTVYFGGPYQLRLEFSGRQRLTVGDQQLEADRITATLKGAASETTFEMFFAQDRARRPLLIRVPLPLGTFSMELAP
jgi:hypothetical protein